MAEWILGKNQESVRFTFWAHMTHILAKKGTEIRCYLGDSYPGEIKPSMHHKLFWTFFTLLMAGWIVEKV